MRARAPRRTPLSTRPIAPLVNCWRRAVDARPVWREDVPIHSFQDSSMKYDFLVETYATERIKVVRFWSVFRVETLPFPPTQADLPGRTAPDPISHNSLLQNQYC